MVKLKRLKIRQYRDVEPCELVFSDRTNVLLGANGAGKTTLLNLVSKVLRENMADANDPLAIDVALGLDGGTLTGTIENVDDPKGASRSTWTPTFNLRLDTGAPDQLIEFRQANGELTFGLERGKDTWTIEHALGPQEGLLRDLMSRLRTGDIEGEDIHVDDVDTDLESAFRFDEGTDVFRTITAKRGDTAIIHPDIRPEIVARLFRPSKFAGSDESIRGASRSGLVPDALLHCIMSRFTEENQYATIEHEALGFLSEMVRLLGVRSATANLELIEKAVGKKHATWTFVFGNLKFWFTRRDGSIFQDQHLSYGQKRLLSFLYYLDANSSFVIADELVNGLHHVWIEECMKAIGDRQAFLTSQNPLLLDYLYFESAEEVKQTFILCRAEPDGDRERMIWRNMTDDEADMFYSAYKVGVEHVGEILRTRGFW